MPGLRGVYNIMATPFTGDGALDEESLRKLADATIRMGVDGITVLGVAGEAQKMLDGERRRVLELVMEVNDGRVPIIVGASQNATDTTIAACKEAEEAGAAGVMVAPPLYLQPGPALTEHFRRLGEAISIPITLQDFLPSNGVTMTPADMAALVNTIPAITTIKLEDPPTPQRVSQTLALIERDEVTILGALGGIYYLDELRRGASGTMTGFAYPEALVAIWRAWDACDRRKAAELYYRYLPLIQFEGQPKLGLAVRKEILRRRGLIATAAVRHPGPRLDQGSLDDLTETIDIIGIDEDFPL
ncbi:MAG: dihydrodipicolinate synthase family protein [Thermomicrobiales bacterium]